jgi:hypothetical protein
MMSATGVIARAAWSRRRLPSSLLIALVIALAAAALAASIVVRAHAADQVDAAFAGADGADLVLYVEPAKWIAKLRATAAEAQDFLLKTEMSAGHGGVSGRYNAWRDRAFSYAWVLDKLGLS